MAQTSATILIIDDEEIIREALEALLTAEGYSVVSAATAGQGLDLIGERFSEVAVIDGEGYPLAERCPTLVGASPWAD